MRMPFGETRRTAWVLLACAAAALPACRVVNTPPVPLGGPGCAGGPLAEHPDGRFTLHVVNESSATPKVDILVCIDGKTAVHHRFAVGDGHNRHTFVFDLAPGPHTLRARSVKGGAHFEQEFTLGEDRRWARLQYWPPGRGRPADSARAPGFTLEIEDRPMMFL